MRCFDFPGLPGQYPKDILKLLSEVFLWHIIHRFQLSSMFCGHKLKQITIFYNYICYNVGCLLKLNLSYSKIEMGNKKTCSLS